LPGLTESNFTYDSNIWSYKFSKVIENHSSILEKERLFEVGMLSTMKNKDISQKAREKARKR
jgi:hypothetical protein